MTLPSSFRFLLAVLAFPFTPSVHAFTYCVANELQLQAALDGASDNGAHATDDVDIHLVVGTYITGVAVLNQPFSLDSTHVTAITIGGGYSADCQQRRIAPAQTVMDGTNATPVLVITKTKGSIGVDDLTIQRGASSSFGAGLAINGPCTGACGNSTASVTRTIIQGNSTTGYCGGLFMQTNQQVAYVAENLIVNNHADTNYGGVCLGGDGGFNQFYGNTVFGNTTTAGTAAAGGAYCYGPSLCQIYDNIFWNNGGVGLWLQANSAFLAFNDYGTRGGDDPQSETGALHVNPQFVDSAGGNFHLLGSSPLIGVTPILLDGTDLLGHPLASSGVQDIGALQETVFRGGFDVVF